MNKCKRCGSHAINENEHGRKSGKDLDLCDVCYWRTIAESKNDGEWTRGYPTEPGNYWFYGYPYGKISCGSENDKELCFVTAKKISNGLMLVRDGSFMYKTSPEDYFFKKAVLPYLPKN